MLEPCGALAYQSCSRTSHSPFCVGQLAPESRSSSAQSRTSSFDPAPRAMRSSWIRRSVGLGRSAVLGLVAVLTAYACTQGLAPQRSFIAAGRSRGCKSSGCQQRAWDDAIPDLPEEYRRIGPLKFGPKPRPFGLLLMPFVLYVYFMADSRRALFRKLDADGDKQLSPSELSDALADLPSGTFNAVDADANGTIDTKEWLLSFLHADLSAVGSQ